MPEIDSLVVSDLTKVILAMPESYSFQTLKSKFDVRDVLESVLLYNEPIGILMNEAVHSQDLVNWVNAAADLGISTDQIGVFFRQENSSPNQKFFNSMIKEFQLNKPVSKDLRIYFLGPKYNKSLIKEGVSLRYFICDNHYVTAHHNMQVMLTNALLKVYHLSEEKKLGDDVVVM